MKRSVILIGRVFLVIGLTRLAGCQKLIDRIFPGPTPNTHCRIIEINQGDRIGIFYYNSHGDLDSVLFDTRSFTSQLFHYKYDEQHRLIAYNGYYDTDLDNYYFRHTYFYSDEGRIVADTARIRQAGSWTQVTFPEYDSLGRVIREAGKVIEAEGDSTFNEETGTLFYDYDQRGNLQPSADIISYDHMINYLSTSKVLMFTERNYSKNNPEGATAYNEQDLPLGFSRTSVVGGLLQWTRPSEIKYDCSTTGD